MPSADSDSSQQIDGIARPRSLQVLGIVSIVAGVLGWWASFSLFLNYTATLKDDSFVPSCDISSVVSCTQNYSSSYGSLFGFSNTVIGLSLFVIPIVLGVLILARVELPGWVYAGYSIGLLGAIVLISYLQFESFTDLKTLCLYCLLIWSVTIPLFWCSLTMALGLSEEDYSHRDTSRGLFGIVSANWWLFALVHLIAVVAFGELSIGAFSGLISAILG